MNHLDWKPSSPYLKVWCQSFRILQIKLAAFWLFHFGPHSSSSNLRDATVNDMNWAASAVLYFAVCHVKGLISIVYCLWHCAWTVRLIQHRAFLNWSIESHMVGAPNNRLIWQTFSLGQGICQVIWMLWLLWQFAGASLNQHPPLLILCSLLLTMWCPPAVRWYEALTNYAESHQ